MEQRSPAKSLKTVDSGPLRSPIESDDAPCLAAVLVGT